MANITRTKIRNGTVVLPPALRKAWRGKEVLMLPQQDQLIIQPLEANWNQYEAKIRKGQGRISQRTIEEAVEWARKTRSFGAKDFSYS